MSRNSSRIAGNSGWSVRMSKAASSMPRAPFETCGRTSAAATGSMPRRSRITLTVRVMSGAVSASVPSRSKSTARIAASGLVTRRPEQVVHVHVAAQRIAARERVVGHAGEVEDAQPRFTAGARKLRGPDEACELVGSTRQQAQDVFGSDDGEGERLCIAVDGGEEDQAAGFHQPRA